MAKGASDKFALPARIPPPKRPARYLERLVKQACGEDFDPVVLMAKLAQDELLRMARANPQGATLEEICTQALEGNRAPLFQYVKELAASKHFVLACLKEVAPYINPRLQTTKVEVEAVDRPPQPYDLTKLPPETLELVAAALRAAQIPDLSPDATRGGNGSGGKAPH